MDYLDIYKKRLNRYGNNYQERVQTERERLFDLYLQKTVYRVDFEYGGEIHSASFERYKQDQSKSLQYLLTKTSLMLPNGTILMLQNQQGEFKPWMVYYYEHIKASGYNKYIMLRMSHYITWTARDGSTQSSWAYMYGQEDNMLKDEIRSRSRTDTLYAEDLKSSFFILPRNQYIKKDDYLEVGEDPFKQSFRVTGFDIQSSEGIEYVTVDPVYEYDLTPPPEQEPEDSDDEFFWLGGG